MITDRKIVIVTRKTRLEELKEKYCTLGQAKFYLEHLGDSIEAYQDEHVRYTSVVKAMQSSVSHYAKVQILERAFLPNFTFNHDDIVVVVGQDGLVANTMKYVFGQPIIAINPLPDLFDGVLLPFSPNDIDNILQQVVHNAFSSKTISLAEVSTNLGQSLLAVNDVFIGPRSHTSARYQIQMGSRIEEQSSSGIIVSTGLGSTGWFKSILAGASGVAGKQVRSDLKDGFPWDSPFLHYSVREPFPSSVTSCQNVFGRVNKQHALKVTSRMAENGVIFSDGIEADALEFNAGTIATVQLSQRQGTLVV